MTTVLFLQVSLTVPEKQNIMQWMFSNEDFSFFNLMLERLSMSKKIEKIFIICSSDSIDDLVMETVEKFTINNPKAQVGVIRIPKNQSYSFFFERNKHMPCLETQDSGIYSLDLFLELYKKISFDKALICSAEHIPLMTGEIIDVLLEKVRKNITVVSFESGSLFILSYQAVIDSFQEIKSEIIQNRKRKLEKLEQKGASEQIKKFQTLFHKPFNLFILNKKIEERILLTDVSGLPFSVFSPFYVLRNESQVDWLKKFIPYLCQVKTFTQSETRLISSFEKIKQLSFDFSKLIEDYQHFQLTSLSFTRIVLDITSKNREDFMSSESLKTFIDNLSNRPLLIDFGLFEDPSLHPDLVLLIQIVKTAGINCLNLKLSSLEYQECQVLKWIEVGVHSITLNLDPIPTEDLFSKLSFWIKLREKKKFLLYLQISFHLQNEQIVQQLYHQYEGLVDEIIVLPDTKEKSMDLTPNFEEAFNQTKKTCRWMNNTICLNHRLEIYLCETKNTVLKNYNQLNKKDLQIQGNHQSCLNCPFKNRNNGIPSLLQSLVFPRINPSSLFYTLLINEIIAKGWFENSAIVHSIPPVVFIPYHSKCIESAKKLIHKKKYDLALDFLEVVLKMNPCNNEVHLILDSILKQLN